MWGSRVKHTRGYITRFARQHENAGQGIACLLLVFTIYTFTCFMLRTNKNNAWKFEENWKRHQTCWCSLYNKIMIIIMYNDSLLHVCASVLTTNSNRRIACACGFVWCSCSSSTHAMKNWICSNCDSFRAYLSPRCTIVCCLHSHLQCIALRARFIWNYICHTSKHISFGDSAAGDI